jgi:hypothetical protein
MWLLFINVLSNNNRNSRGKEEMDKKARRDPVDILDWEPKDLAVAKWDPHFNSGPTVTTIDTGHRHSPNAIFGDDFQPATGDGK